VCAVRVQLVSPWGILGGNVCYVQFFSHNTTEPSLTKHMDSGLGYIDPSYYKPPGISISYAERTRHSPSLSNHSIMVLLSPRKQSKKHQAASQANDQRGDTLRVSDKALHEIKQIATIINNLLRVSVHFGTNTRLFSLEMSCCEFPVAKDLHLLHRFPGVPRAASRVQIDFPSPVDDVSVDPLAHVAVALGLATMSVDWLDH
jgi:hypothetical protein